MSAAWNTIIRNTYNLESFPGHFSFSPLTSHLIGKFIFNLILFRLIMLFPLSDESSKLDSKVCYFSLFSKTTLTEVFLTDDLISSGQNHLSRLLKSLKSVANVKMSCDATQLSLMFSHGWWMILGIAKRNISLLWCPVVCWPICKYLY